MSFIIWIWTILFKARLELTLGKDGIVRLWFLGLFPKYERVKILIILKLYMMYQILELFDAKNDDEDHFWYFLPKLRKCFGSLVCIIIVVHNGIIVQQIRVNFCLGRYHKFLNNQDFHGLLQKLIQASKSLSNFTIVCYNIKMYYLIQQFSRKRTREQQKIVFHLY